MGKESEIENAFSDEKDKIAEYIESEFFMGYKISSLTLEELRIALYQKNSEVEGYRGTLDNYVNYFINNGYDDR